MNMNARIYYTHFIFSVMLVLAFFFDLNSCYAAGNKKTNIILILSDDMGFSDLGCFGSEINTPNLDRLAAKGVRFTQFYNTARCCPTRASLLTGLHPHQAGVGHMAQDNGLPGYRGRIGKDTVTIAQVLRQAGYATFAAGKWHVSGSDSGPKKDISNWPCQRGFDRYYGTINGPGNYFDPSLLLRDNSYITAPTDELYQPDNYYYTDALSDNMASFIQQHIDTKPEQPFFSYIAYTAAHWPMQAPEEDIARYKGKYDSGYDAVRRARYEKMQQLGIINSQTAQYTPTEGDWSKVEHREWEIRCMEVYAAMIDKMDQGIGKIVDTLEKNGQLDNTVIFYLQDNGACAEDMGRTFNPAWQLTDINPLEPHDIITRDKPPMQTREGLPVLGGPDVMPGPGTSFIAYGKAWANVSNTPFRMYKHWIQEGGIATPLIVHWPDGIEQNSSGRLRQQPGQLPDIMATCLEITQVSYPAQYNGNVIVPCQGVSLVDAFNSDEPLDREALYWEHEGNRGIRIGDYKLVSVEMPKPRHYEKVDLLSLEKWQLFNIAQDRCELNDLAPENPQMVRDMAQKWQKWAQQSRVVPKPYSFK